MLLRSKYPRWGRSTAGSNAASWAEQRDASHLPSSDTFILEDESKATRNTILTFLLTLSIWFNVFSDRSFCGVGVRVCLDTILTPSPAATSAGSRRSLRMPTLKAQTEAAGWHCPTHSNAEPVSILLASMVSALELFSSLILRCLPLSKQIQDISLPGVAPPIHANGSPCCVTSAFPQGNPASRQHKTYRASSCFSLFKLLCTFLGSRTPSLLNNGISRLDLERYH